jgi:TP901 family phage tail tape measure protein
MANNSYSIGSLFVSLGLDDKGLKSGSQSATSVMSGLGKQAAATALGFIGANSLMSAFETLKGAMVNSVKDYAAFQKAMAEVSTLVDTSKVNMKELEDGVRSLSGQFGMSGQGLAKALYQTISAGVPAAESIKFLDVATKAAIGGVTDAFTTVNALTSGLNAYGMKASQVTEISDALFETVKYGKTTMAELSPAIGTIAPLAANAGIAFDEMAAAMATLTLAGVDTSTAATALRAIVSSMIKPSDEAANAAKMLGLEWSAAALKEKGLKGALDELFKATQGDTEALGIMIPEVRALNGALILGGTGAEKFTEIIAGMADKTGATEVAFGKMQNTLSFKWDVLTTQFKGIGKSVAEDLTPILYGVVAALTELTKAFKFLFSTYEAGIKQVAKLVGGFDGFSDKVMSSEEQLGKYTIKLKILNDMLKDQQAIMAKAPEEDREKVQKRIEEINQAIKSTQFMIKGFQDRIDKEKGVGAAAKDTAKVVDAATQKQLDAQKKIIEAMKKKLGADKDAQNAQEQFQTKAISMANEILKMEEESANRKMELARKGNEIRYSYMEAQKNAEIEALNLIASDENLFHEERLAAARDASQKRLELIEIQRQAAIQAAKDELAIESDKYLSKINMAEQKLGELDKLYRDENGKIKAGYEQEYNDRKKSLDGMISDTETALDTTFNDYKVTSDKINKEFDVSVTKETKALYKINYEISGDTFDKLMRNIRLNYDKWINELEAGNTSAWSGMVSDSGEAIKAIAGMFGELPSDLAPVVDSMVNILTSALSGNPIQTATAIFGAIGKAIWGAGERSKEAAEQEKRAADQALSAAKAFLKSQGKLDLSMATAAEVGEYMVETSAQFADLMKGLGMGMPGGLSADLVLDMFTRFQKAETQGGVRGYFTPQDFDAIKTALTTKQTGFGGFTAQKGLIEKQFGPYIAGFYADIYSGTKTVDSAMTSISDTFRAIQQLTLTPEVKAVMGQYGKQAGAYAALTSSPGATTGATTWLGKRGEIENKIARGELTQEEGAQELLKIANSNNPATGKPYWYEMSPNDYAQIQANAAAARPAFEVQQINSIPTVTGGAASGYGTSGWARAKYYDASTQELYLDGWAKDVTAKYQTGKIKADEFKTNVMAIAKGYMDLSKQTGISAPQASVLQKKANDLVAASANVWQDIYGAATIGVAGGGGPSTVSVPGNTVDSSINSAEEALDEEVKRLNLQWALGKVNSSELKKEVFRIANQYRAYAKEDGISEIKSLVLQKKANDLVGAYANVWQEEYGLAHYGDTGGGTSVTAGATLPSPLGEQLGVSVLPGMVVGRGATGSEFINAVEQLTSSIMGAKEPLLPEHMDISVTVTSGGAITDEQANTISITIGEAIGANMTSQGEVP